MYIKGSIETYLSDLAARKPSPGGGSVAALGAALGVGLMSMVANYTIGNPKYKESEKKASDILAKCEAARKIFERLVDEDADSYGKLSKIMKETKDPARLEAAYKEALTPPFETCKLAAECLRLCDKLVDCANKYLITDAAIAAIYLEGAFFSAKYNVYENLKYIKDVDYIGGIHRVLQPLEEELPKLKEEILEKCEEVIK